MCIFMIYMTKMNIQEGSINVRPVVVKVMDVLKKTIKGLYSKKVIQGGNMVIEGKFNVVIEAKFQTILDYINNEIKHRLYDSGVISCPIRFVIYLKDTNVAGGYNPYHKIIMIDGYEYFTKDNSELGVEVYKNFSDIRFDDISRTIEHELVHQQQDERSGGKFIHNRKEGVTDAEIKSLLKNKNNIDPEMKRSQFIKQIKYFNDSVELDSYANNVADEYIQYKVKEMRTMINYRVKHDNEEVRNYSVEEVREYVLRGILKSNEGRFGSKLDIQRKLIQLSVGYKFLTVINRKKYWKYLFKSLLVNRFEPMIFVK